MCCAIDGTEILTTPMGQFRCCNTGYPHYHHDLRHGVIVTVCGNHTEADFEEWLREKLAVPSLVEIVKEIEALKWPLPSVVAERYGYNHGIEDALKILKSKGVGT